MSLMRTSGVGRFVDDSTGWVSSAFKVVDEGVGSSIRRPKMVCLRLR